MRLELTQKELGALQEALRLHRERLEAELSRTELAEARHFLRQTADQLDAILAKCEAAEVESVAAPPLEYAL